MKFFIDNNLPPKLARALAELSGSSHQVIHLKEKFEQSTPDVEWINELSSEGGWVVITLDRLKKGDQEKEALRRSGLIVFILDKQWSKMQFWDKAYKLVHWWPLIINQSNYIAGGAAFRVPWRISGKGKFQQLKI